MDSESTSSSSTEPQPSIRRRDEENDTLTEGVDVPSVNDNETKDEQQTPNDTTDTTPTDEAMEAPAVAPGTNDAETKDGAAETTGETGENEKDIEEKVATAAPVVAPVDPPVENPADDNESVPTSGAEKSKKSPEEKKDPEPGGEGKGDGSGNDKEVKSSNPTLSPTAALTRPPTLSPVDPPVQSKDDQDGGGNDQNSSNDTTDRCQDATTCESCTEKANELDSSESMTCWWTDGVGCAEETTEAHDFEQRCSDGKMPTTPPVADTWDEDKESLLPLLSGLGGILVIVYLLYRKLCGGQILAGGHAIGEHGKYQGLCVILDSKCGSIVVLLLNLCLS